MVSQDVLFQGRRFFYAVFLGGILLLAYDCMRLLRIFVRHRQWAMAAEEIVFWIAAAAAIYSMIYHCNSGAVRNYIVCGMGLGMLLYRSFLSSFFIRGMSGILRPVRKTFQIFKTFVKNAAKLLKSAVSRRTIKVRKLRYRRQGDHDGGE